MSKLIISIVFLGILVVILLSVALGLQYYDRQRRTRLSGMLSDPQAEAGAGTSSVLLQQPEADNNPLARLLSASNFSRG